MGCGIFPSCGPGKVGVEGKEGGRVFQLLRRFNRSRFKSSFADLLKIV